MVGRRSQRVQTHLAVGRLLKAARRQQRLPLEEAARALNVPAGKLKALEQGDFSVFAAEVYGRGAYLAYAAHLGVNVERAEKMVSLALSEAREQVPLTLHTPLRWFQRILTARTMTVLAISFVVMVAAGYILWQVRSFWRLPYLDLSQPQGAVTHDQEVVIQGRAERDARVLVNEEPVLVGSEGQFEYKLEFRPGINVLRVEAENAAGRRRVIERPILVPRTS